MKQTVTESVTSELREAASLAVTRELIYTAITRARLGFSIASPEDPLAVLSAAMQRKTRRSGGLFARVAPGEDSGPLEALG